MLTITKLDGTLQCYLLRFSNSNRKDKDTVTSEITETLVEFGLKDHFSEGKVPFISDGGLKSVAEDLTPSYSVCGAHTFACVSKRTVTKNLHFTGLDKCWKNVQLLLQNANKKQSFKEGKETLRMSINDYIQKQAVTTSDQTYIAQLKNSNFNDMSEADKKLIESKIVKYGSIVNYFEIRFRSLYESLTSLLIVKNVYKKLESRTSKPEFELVRNYPIDFDFIEALYEFAKMIRIRLHIQIFWFITL